MFGDYSRFLAVAFAEASGYAGRGGAIEQPAKSGLHADALGLGAGGWEGRSDQRTFDKLVIFEVGGILEASQFRAWACGSGFAFKSVQGSWKGKHQPSFVAVDSPENRVKLAFWLKGQEAVLALSPAYRMGPDGMARLYGHREAIADYLDSDGYTVYRREALGLFQPVSFTEAKSHTGWTFDPTDNQYYTIL